LKKKCLEDYLIQFDGELINEEELKLKQQKEKQNEKNKIELMLPLLQQILLKFIQQLLNQKKELQKLY
jgi:asparagine synthetase B (glutamine-hydrolysing)